MNKCFYCENAMKPDEFFIKISLHHPKGMIDTFPLYLHYECFKAGAGELYCRGFDDDIMYFNHIEKINKLNP